MTCRLPETMNSALPGVLILSHSTLAAGLYASLNMILGESENIGYLCFEETTDPDVFGKKISDAIDRFPAGCLVLVDLMGGTPFNQLMLHAPRDKFRAVCGVNLPMLLEVVSNRDDATLDELTGIAMDAGKNGLVDVSAKLLASRVKTEN